MSDEQPTRTLTPARLFVATMSSGYLADTGIVGAWDGEYFVIAFPDVASAQLGAARVAASIISAAEHADAPRSDDDGH